MRTLPGLRGHSRKRAEQRTYCEMSAMLDHWRKIQAFPAGLEMIYSTIFSFAKLLVQSLSLIGTAFWVGYHH